MNDLNDLNEPSEPKGPKGPKGPSDLTRSNGPNRDAESELRDLLHAVVADLEPSDGALDRLRHAVPARRARRRNTLVGAAAAVLLAGAGIPTVVHLAADPDGTDVSGSAIAGHQQDAVAHGGSGSDPHATGSGAVPKSSELPAKSGPGTAGTGQKPGTTADPGQQTPGGQITDPTTTFGPRPPAPGTPGAPACTAAQLGVTGAARTPDADGKVYGSFRVTNVSTRGCTVAGADTVSADAGTTVLRHTANDPATGLPDPSSDAASLVLPPNTSYEVRFAWVPGTQSCSSPSPTPAAAGGQDGAPVQPAAGSDPSGAPAGSSGLQVTLTPQPGAPATGATVPSACGGTVYRTGALPVAPPAP
ncbi:hypothetical protein [Streptomyces bambusae]|uniref:DUF4232 domain-containing protein n=1 Tax=Streptomyces bambusae TaxID=1550616 RepID=A0ABS6Z7C2_9ACTN|nr:hypothetical protein [Streptomyces bambusae]MBW5482586.1 hypothetical protein [Streptomyces bambusae]